MNKKENRKRSYSLRKELFEVSLVDRKLSRNCFHLIIPDKVTREEKVSIFVRQKYVSLSQEKHKHTQTEKSDMGLLNNTHEN